MNLIDILVCAVLAIFMVKGFMKGLVREVCSLLGLIVGGWAAFTYYPVLASASRHLIQLPSAISSVLAFIVLFSIVGLLFLFIGQLLTLTFKLALLGGVNRAGGMIFGFLQAGLILSMILYIAIYKGPAGAFRARFVQSKTAQPFALCGREIIAGWDGAKTKPAEGQPITNRKDVVQKK